MGLRPKSVSLPKLSIAKTIEIGMGQKNWKAGCNELKQEHDLTVKSGVCQLGSDNQNREDTGCFNEESEKEDMLKVQQQINTGFKERHDRKPSISSRLRGIFQSLFHLDKGDKGTSRHSHRISSHLDNEFALQTDCSKSKSLPNLYRTGRSSRKPLISTLLRKSRRRINSFRQRNRSLTSFYTVTSNDSLQDFARSLPRHYKSNGFNDVSLPNSPTNSDFRPVFHSSVECSPASLKKQSSFSSEETGHVSAKLRRERFRRSRTTDVRKRHNSDRFASFSESSDVTEEGDSLDLNDVIISNASMAVQNRRKMPKYKTPEESLVIEKHCEEKEEQNEDVEKEYSKETWIKALNKVAEMQLKLYLNNRIFDPDHSKDWCSDIGELMRNKVQTEAKGGFKIIVQVFIGAIEGDGIRTATQCNLNPRCDNFIVVSFRNNSLFAFASLFIVDVREP